jgi:hypothetical protein
MAACSVSRDQSGRLHKREQRRRSTTSRQSSFQLIRRRRAAGSRDRTWRLRTWSGGHRNPLGLAFAPDGRLWEVEHGPRGGDEPNLITLVSGLSTTSLSRIAFDEKGRAMPADRWGVGFRVRDVEVAPDGHCGCFGTVAGRSPAPCSA